MLTGIFVSSSSIFQVEWIRMVKFQRRLLRILRGVLSGRILSQEFLQGHGMIFRKPSVQVKKRLEIWA